MDKLTEKIRCYVEAHIAEFHDNRLRKLNTLELNKLLKKKNPYLYKAKDLNTPEAVVRGIAAAFMSSAEETMFGDWLEGLAVFIAKEVYSGKKSSAEGIDLEMDIDGIHYIVSIKSGPNWSNSSSMSKLKQNFEKAKRIYHTGGNKNHCEAVEGCCYGQKTSSKTTTHTTFCGQSFWEFISGSKTLYLDIIEPLGCKALEMNHLYKKEYDKMITKFTKEFVNTYCDEFGNIDWNKIVAFNSKAKP